MFYWRVISVQKFVLIILTVTVNEESKFPASAKTQNPNRRTNNCWTYFEYSCCCRDMEY